ncbi:MAG: hypothetical protein ACI8RZ_000482 [Myxococcota bacterium]|jgi:hypothetical protein
MRLLTTLLLLSACTGDKIEDDDEEAGSILPNLDTDETDTATEDTDTDTEGPIDTGDPVDTGEEPEEHGVIEVSQTSLKFTADGTVAVDLSNTGEAGLTISEIAVSGEGEEAFSVGSPGATTLAPDSSTSFSVTFAAPLESGGWRSEIAITSSDPDNETILIEVVGGVGEPQLDFDENPLEISDAYLGCETIGTAVLRNDGGGFIEVTELLMEGDEAMTLGKSDAVPFSLLSGETADVEINYLPTDELDDSGYLVVTTEGSSGSLKIQGTPLVYDEGAEFFELDKPTTIFKLSDVPVETTIEVRVDGVDQSGSFTYDTKTNAVFFKGDSVPASGSVVEIEYAIAGGC